MDHTDRKANKIRLVIATATVAGASLLAAACSSGPAPPGVASLSGQTTTSAAPSSSGEAAAESDAELLQYTQCLRAHGVHERDPFHNPGHSGLTVDIPPPTAANAPAIAACKHFIAKLLAVKKAGASVELAHWLPKLTQYAQCMRAHDIPMLDPGAQGQLSLGSVPGISDDFGRYSPQFRSADGVCKHFLPAAVHDDGTGP
jgi:hypothetical protein